MAKGRKGEGGPQAGGGTSATHTSKQDARMGDITTAASAAMAAADYSHGYTPNEGELVNQNFSSRNKGNPTPPGRG